MPKKYYILIILIAAILIAHISLSYWNVPSRPYYMDHRGYKFFYRLNPIYVTNIHFGKNTTAMYDVELNSILISWHKQNEEGTLYRRDLGSSQEITMYWGHWGQGKGIVFTPNRNTLILLSKDYLLTISIPPDSVKAWHEMVLSKEESLRGEPDLLNDTLEYFKLPKERIVLFMSPREDQL